MASECIGQSLSHGEKRVPTHGQKPRPNLRPPALPPLAGMILPKGLHRLAGRILLLPEDRCDGTEEVPLVVRLAIAGAGTSGNGLAEESAEEITPLRKPAEIAEDARSRRSI